MLEVLKTKYICLKLAESEQFDVISVSEACLSQTVSSWILTSCQPLRVISGLLSQTDTNRSIHLNNYYPQIRRNRPNDPHGGVAVREK